jgi:hypothetical protein
LDVNGKLNVFGDPGFGLIQLQGNGTGIGQETGIFSKDCLVGGVDNSNGWYYGQSHLQGATLSNFIIRRVNTGGAGVNPVIQITPGCNVGINNSNPQHALDVAGRVRAYYFTAENDLYVAGSGQINQGVLINGNNGPHVTNIFGNVGINVPNSNPQYSLDVRGIGSIQSAILGALTCTGISGFTASLSIGYPTVQNNGYMVDVSGNVNVKTANNNYIRLVNAGAENMPSIIFGSNTSLAAIGYNATNNTITYGFGMNPCNVFLGPIHGNGIFANAFSAFNFGGIEINCKALGNVAYGTNGLTLTSGNGVRFAFYAPDITTGALSSNTFHLWQYGPNSGSGVELLRVLESDTTRKFQWNGAMQVVGTLQKGGGSFTIDHPVVPSTILIHSFIEGPRCDLIYRNRKQLSNGYAEIDIEKECTANDSTMSPGTFEALCTNPQTFLQNNETFDRVKGYVSSHMLFITCENPESTAMIDWQVIAERHDPFIKKWDMTDSNGLLIVEHPKLV